MGVELAVELRRLEQEGRTGMLRVGDGAFHLAGGAIASVECGRTTGLDRLVVEAGVVSAADWQRAGAGDPDSLLGNPRLEALAMLSVFDAAYFLLASPSVSEFRPAPAHWLAPVCRIPPGVLVRECARRGDTELGPWPAGLVDRAPVVATRGRHRRRPVLPGGQADVLAAADGCRSVAGIARDLGRTTYGCLVAVRDLTAAGLIERPPPGGSAEPVIEPLPRRRAPAVPESAPRRVVRGMPESLPQRQVRAVPEFSPQRQVRATAEALPQRWEPVDQEMLTRVLVALEGLA